MRNSVFFFFLPPSPAVFFLYVHSLVNQSILRVLFLGCTSSHPPATCARFLHQLLSPTWVCANPFTHPPIRPFTLRCAFIRPRGSQFAFVTLALSEVLPEGSIDATNIGCGSLCPVPPNLNPDTMLPGILFITKVLTTVEWGGG